MDNELKQEEFTRLENRIWTTYQVRIKAATRLNKYAKYLDFFSAYYTIFLAILSTFSLIYPNSIIGYFTNALSIIVMGMVFYGNSMNFKDRHLNMKDNYLKLGDLYYKCINERINKSYDINKIYQDYSSLLNISENHTTHDYLCHKMNRFKENEKEKELEKKDTKKSENEIYISSIEKTKYYISYWFEKVMVCFIFAIPIYLFLLSIMEMFY